MQRNRNKSNYDLFSNQDSIGVGLEEIYIFYPYKQYNLVFLELNSLFFNKKNMMPSKLCVSKLLLHFESYYHKKYLSLSRHSMTRLCYLDEFDGIQWAVIMLTKNIYFYLLVHYSKICFMGHVYLIFCTCTFMNIV